MIPDNKKGWSLVKKTQDVIVLQIEAANDNLQAIKTTYQNANPDVNVEGFPLTAQEVSDANTLISNYAAFLSDNAATMSMLKAKNVGSHKGNALD